MATKETLRTTLAFAALDPYIETNIVSAKEVVLTGKGYIQWGDRNQFPEYLLGLYKDVPTLRSIINGCRDFVTGDAQTTAKALPGNEPGTLNRRGDTVQYVVQGCAEDFFIYGGFALQVIRDKSGRPTEIYNLPLRYLRSNKERTVFYYSEDWAKSRQKVLEYPAFLPGLEDKWAALDDKARETASASVVFVSNERTQTYPFPIYGAALVACETERAISEYHLNAICNGFAPSAIINFNNGIPTDEVKEEIERNVNEKFAGHQNAGRVMLSWNPNKDSATTIEVPKTEDFGEKYKALASSVRQAIFTAFRANPNLFGIPTESLGFSQEEYESAFRLFNRTVVRPAQQVICDAFDRVFGAPGSLTIAPFSLEETSEQNVQ